MADHDRLDALHTALIDSLNGYGKALEEPDTPSDVRAVLEKARSLHHAAHEDVHRMLAGAGATPDDEGSFMTTVHPTVIGVRAATVGLGEGALSSFASGEENNLAKYDEAIAENPSDSATLQRHRDALAAAVDEMKGLAAKA